jgi:transposase-like protein
MIGVLTGKEPPMKDTARRRTKIQETTTEQVVFAAMHDARATLHEAVVAAGMAVLSAMLEEDRTKLCGARYVHDPDRRASRAGHTEGQLGMGGRRVRVRRPRVRGADGGEVPLETWERFAGSDPLTPRAVEQMVLGVSTRNYERSLDSAPSGIRSRGASKSAVSRRFVGATRAKLAEMMSRDLSALPLCAVMIDGIHTPDDVGQLQDDAGQTPDATDAADAGHPLDTDGEAFLLRHRTPLLRSCD